jgi:hypothetical protein
VVVRGERMIEGVRKVGATWPVGFHPDYLNP